MARKARPPIQARAVKGYGGSKHPLKEVEKKERGKIKKWMETHRA